MDIGITGEAILVLKKPIDESEPTRIFVNIERALDTGVLLNFEDSDDTKRTAFVPYSNIRAIERPLPDEEENSEDEDSESNPEEELSYEEGKEL